MGEGASIPAYAGKKQRRLKNLLLDPHFQLKYTGYLMLIAVVLSGSLGLMLWRTSAQVLVRSELSATNGAQIVSLGDEVVDESRKVSAVVRMNIVNDPEYQRQPELLEVFNADAAAQDQRLAAQKQTLERQRRRLADDAATLRRYHSHLVWTLIGLLTALVLGIGAAGIVVTHKVAGPIFKMKRHLREVTDGHLVVPWGLRKGDELVEFFEVFRDMIQALRGQREHQIERLNTEINGLSAQLPDEALDGLRKLRDELQDGLS